MKVRTYNNIMKKVHRVEAVTGIRLYDVVDTLMNAWSIVESWAKLKPWNPSYINYNRDFFKAISNFCGSRYEVSSPWDCYQLDSLVESQIRYANELRKIHDDPYDTQCEVNKLLGKVKLSHGWVRVLYFEEIHKEEFPDDYYDDGLDEDDDSSSVLFADLAVSEGLVVPKGWESV